MYRRPLVITVILLALALVGSAAALGASQPAASTYTGTLTVIVGDPMPVAGEPMTPIPPIFTLYLADGRQLPLLPGAAGENDLLRLAGQQVSVTLPAAEAESALAADDPAAPGVPVASAALAPGTVMVSPEVSGNTKWLSIACRFPDVADQPRTMRFFREMYANTYPGLDRYWREASYDAINLAGSTAVGWYTMPHPLAYYQIDDDTARLPELFLDCAAQADPTVNFASFMGVNLMFNAEMGCCAWGGLIAATLDGVARNWPVTWLPPWGYADLSYVQHEMTHAYGILWHSYADGYAYGDPWDVVSCAYCTSAVAQPYGGIGFHTQAYHRYYLGWIPGDRVATVGAGKTTLTLERATQPGAAGALLAIIPINGSGDHFYALEARQQIGYDSGLIGESITIHEIGGSPTVLLMDPIIDQAGENIWRAGDVWVAPEGGILVRVDAATSTGFTVSVWSGLETRMTTLNPTADAYVDHQTPDTNYGHSPTLPMFGSLTTDKPDARAAFLRFDPAQAPPLVAHAWLLMTLAEGEVAGLPPRVSAYPATYVGTNTEWQEDEVTWNNIQHNLPLPALWRASPADGHALVWDIRNILATYGSQGIRSLLVEDPAVPLVFSSREGVNPPTLTIEYVVPPEDYTTTTTFTPTNDATVNQAKPKLVSGGQPTLQVKDAAKDLNAYVKFNVTGLDGAVQSATLRLWVVETGWDGGRVYATSPFYRGTTTQWLETGLKWSNAPAISGAPLDDAGTVIAGYWIELDVTGAVTGNGRASFALTNDTNDLVVYGSKEGVYAPELVIVTD